MALFNGSGVAMITPFDENGINYDALGKIVDHITGAGTNALIVLGTTGEPCTMTLEERESVLSYCIKRVNGKIPVFAGSGGNDTAEAVRFSKRCETLGADGLLVVTPYYNKCTQNGLVAHFGAISDSVNIPIIVYNVPGRTGFNIAPATYAKLADIKNVRGVKEASGSIEQISEVIRIVGDRLDIYSGDDSMTVPAMSLGAKGVISVAGNLIPSVISEITSLCIKSDYAAAAALYRKIAAFVKALFIEVNPIPCKKAMQLAGFNAGLPRLPLTEMETENATVLECEMRKLAAFGFIKGLA